MQQALPILVIVGIIAVILLISVLAHKAEQKRKAKLQQSLESMGFTLELASAAAVPGLERVFPNLPMLVGGASNVKWSAWAQPEGGLPIWILEHTYSTGSGKNRRTHHHTVALTHCPQDWWRFTLTPEGFFHRLGESWGLTKKDVELEDPAFNKRWRIKCDDDSTVLAVLTPEVQAALVGGPMEEVWVVGRGVFACVWTRLLVDGDAAPILNRLSAVIQQLAPEVRDMLAQTPLTPSTPDLGELDRQT